MKNLFLFIALVAVTSVAFAQGNLQFNQVKIVSSTQETVPSGKVWKIVNIYVEQVEKFVPSTGSGTCNGGAPCNGRTTRWYNFTLTSCPTASDFQSSPQIEIDGTEVWFNSNSPLWLPAGATLKGAEFNCTSSTGWYDGNGYSCHCPPSSNIVNASVVVLEFNIVP